MNDYVVGYTREYINDFQEWRMVSVIPEVAAVAWLQSACPQHPYLDGWMNKGWVVVENGPSYDVALYNHDVRFYIYRRDV